MMPGEYFGGNGDFAPGDQVQQIALISLGMLDKPQFVVGVHPDGIELASSPDASPRTDLDGRPRLYPSSKFRKVA